jgi:LmbE family N-acetylglucosaminyl deacetylase
MLDRAPVLHHADLLSGVSTAVVVAPHPDDETLGAGGLIAALCAAGVDTSVVICTDGSAAELRPPIEPDRLATLRAAEVRAAVDVLSDGRIEPQLLGLPDGRSSEPGVDLVGHLSPLLREADLVVGPWSGDGHSDHMACGVAVQAACPPGAVLLEYPVWAWHWDDPMDTALCNLVRVPVSHGARRRKQDAVRCHRSQLDGDRPMLTDLVLEHFDRSSEAFVLRDWGRLRHVERSSAEFFEAMYRADPDRDP